MAKILNDCIYFKQSKYQNCSNCKYCYKTLVFKKYKCEVVLGVDLTDMLDYCKCGMWEGK